MSDATPIPTTATFGEYQTASRKTALYIEKPINPMLYTVLGLVGETGEIAEKTKKLFRDGDGTMTAEQRELMQKELGDVLWYLTQLATELGLKLEDIAQGNIEKLYSRLDRNKLHGSGDTR